MDLVNLESIKNRTIIRGEDVSGTIEGRVLWKAKILVFVEETRWQLSDLMVQERQRLLKNCSWESWYFIIAICQNRLF